MAFNWSQYLPEWLYGYEPAQRGLYTGYARGQGGSRNFQNWLQSYFPEAQSRYYAATMPDIMAGQTPSLGFSDFLRNLNLGQEYRGLSPRERGETPSLWAQPKRWLFR